jgi:glycerol-3-phosphate acyltransferase PlsY
MSVIEIIAVCLTAYGLGSIATAVWAGKIFHGIDVRDYGSGNAGATNTIRVLGWYTGIPVLIIDIAKGAVAANLPLILNVGGPGSEEQINLQIVAGLISIIGHVIPVFSDFKGGKGVATTFGVLLALAPLVTLASLGAFMAVLLITGYVSASSVMAGLLFPVILHIFFDSPSAVFTAFSILIAFAIVVTHQNNIKRLLKGEENRFIWKNRQDRREKRAQRREERSI